MPQPPIQLQVTLEFITPAVLGGSRPRRVDPYMPLRPASLRGLWRYWFRAIAASLMWPERGDRDGQRMIEELLAAETRLFGDTKRRSRLVLLPPELTKTPHKGVIHPLEIPRPESGLRYLGYGLFEDPTKRPPECIPEGTTATLTCLLRSPHPDHEDLRALCATLWTWATLGGIGGRSRRGYGSVQILKFTASERLAQLLKPWNDLTKLQPTPDAYLTALGQGIGRAQDAFTTYLRAEKLGDRQLKGDAAGPHEAIRTLEGIAEVRGLRHNYSRSLDALDHAGHLFRDYRSTLRRRDRNLQPLPDYHEVKASLSPPFSAPRSVDRAAFGLPLRFYFRSLNGNSTTFTPSPAAALHSDKPLDRLASPLLFRIYKLESDKFGVALINLAGKQSAPPLQGCKLLSQRSKGLVPPPSPRIIKDFVEWAISQPLPQQAPARPSRR